MLAESQMLNRDSSKRTARPTAPERRLSRAFAENGLTRAAHGPLILALLRKLPGYPFAGAAQQETRWAF